MASASLDVSLDPRLESLVRLARRQFRMSVALIMRAEAQRQWVAASDGRPFRQTPADLSFCASAIRSDSLIQLDVDASAPALDADEPPVCFYAGYPILHSQAGRLGAICLLDVEPRTLDAAQSELLKELAELAAAILAYDGQQAILRQQDETLREREQRFALAIEGSGTGVWDRNICTNETYYSPSWKAMLGYSDAEIGNRIDEGYSRLHPEDLPRIRSVMRAHFEQRSETYEIEHRLRCRDRSYKWVVTRGKIISRDASGRPLRIIGTSVDISSTRAIADELQRTLGLVTDLTNEVPGLVFQYRQFADDDACMPYASAGIREIYELEPEDVAQSVAPIERVIHPDDLDAYRASFVASAANLSAWHLEYRVRLATQGIRWRQGAARPSRLADGSVVWHGFITDVTKRKHIEAELQESALIDFLTQLPNRRHFTARIEAELARIRRGNAGCAAVLMWDLDYFKTINDTWGHAVGDAALRHFASILRNQLRETDIAGRLGGEEFAVMLCGANFAAATSFALRVQRAIAQTPLRVDGEAVVLTASVGIAVMDPTDTSADSSLSRSDLALYRAKASGRNRIECH